MGHCAAMNIHRQLLHQRNGSSFELEELSEFPPFIGLAVGKKAVCYSSTTGTTSGEDLMEIMFGDDLGNTSMKNTALTRLPFTRWGPRLLLTYDAECWDYLQLSRRGQTPE